MRRVERINKREAEGRMAEGRDLNVERQMVKGRKIEKRRVESVKK